MRRLLSCFVRSPITEWTALGPCCKFDGGRFGTVPELGLVAGVAPTFGEIGLGFFSVQFETASLFTRGAGAAWAGAAAAASVA
jgi:hypothetical protein